MVPSADPRESFNNFYAKRAAEKEDPEHMNMIDGLLSGEKKFTQLVSRKEVVCKKILRTYNI